MANNKKIIKSASIYHSTESYINMFKDYENLEEVDLTNVKNKEDVMFTTNMFNNCQNIKSINMSNWDTSNIVDSTGMFKGISEILNWNYDEEDENSYSNFKLTEVNAEYADLYPWNFRIVATYIMNSSSNDLPTFNNNFNNYRFTDTDNGDGTKTRNIKVGESYSGLKFINCSNITHINYLDTTTLTDFSYMFSGCTKLTSINMNDWDTSDVTSMSYMFYNCNSITTLNLSHFITNNVTDMSGMFRLCTNLNNLDLTNFNINNVINTDCMFCSCTSLDTLDISTWDTSSIKSSGNMFNNCNEIINWNYLGSNYLNWTLSEIATGYAYSFPWNLDNKFVMIYTINPRNTTDKISAAYTYNNTVYPYYLPQIYTNSSTFTVANNYELILHNGTKTTSSSTLASNVKYVKVFYPKNTYTFKFRSAINSSTGAFYSECRLKELISAVTNNIIDFNYMYHGCTQLTYINTNGWNTSNVINMSGMFNRCTALEEVNLAHFDTGKVTSFRTMFDNCTSLKEINIKNWNTSSATDFVAMFDDCMAVKVLDLTGWNVSNVTDMTSMFGGYDLENMSLEEILGLETWNVSQVTNMKGMFKNCKNLKKLNLSTWNTSNVTNSVDMFTGVPEINEWFYNGENYQNFTLTEDGTGYDYSFPWS